MALFDKCTERHLKSQIQQSARLAMFLVPLGAFLPKLSVSFLPERNRPQKYFEPWEQWITISGESQVASHRTDLLRVSWRQVSSSRSLQYHRGTYSYFWLCFSKSPERTHQKRILWFVLVHFACILMWGAKRSCASLSTKIQIKTIHSSLSCQCEQSAVYSVGRNVVKKKWSYPSAFKNSPRVRWSHLGTTV